MVFKNETLRDFSKNSEREAIQKVLESIPKQLPFIVPISVGEKEVFSNSYHTHKNPWSPDQIVSKVSLATSNDVDLAIGICKKNWDFWKRLTQDKRSEILIKTAEILLKKKDYIISVCIWETGKHVTEAEIEFAETIDFCRYYAITAIEELKPKTKNLLGEDNLYYYHPKGIVGSISPWNFPMAIFTGMCAGPLVVGNAVLAKPAEETSATAYEITKCFWEAGVPREVFHFLPGLGSEVGQSIVSHPEVSLINFTGSREVGLSILKTTSIVLPNQRLIKKVVCELGGKNAMIVDEDADMDVAITSIMSSAFGFQGQKCSALSRLYVHQNSHLKLKERLVSAIEGLQIGSPLDFANRIGPVIHEESYLKLKRFQNENQSFLIAQTLECPEVGFFIPPSLYEPPMDSPLWTTELFGPLLPLKVISNFYEGITLCNHSDYALTCGLISRNPKHIEEAKIQIEAGNLYINRGITGAVVERQPFGGGKLSGTGAKAGGPDYLKLFVEGKTYTENTMRQGFSPDTLQ